MHLNLRITQCLKGIIRSKSVMLIGLVLLSLTSFKASAHSVQVGYVVLPNGFLRVYIEHWHGALSTAQLVNNGMSITTTYGSTTVTQNVNPTGAFNGYAWNNLPGAGTNIILLATSTRANTQNNWAYYDFAPAACGVPVNIVLNGGLTVVLTESEPQIWPQTISATFIDNSAPTITPANTTTTVACGVAGANVNFSATAIDNCTPNPAVTFSVPSGSFFPVGTTAVIAYSADANGNSGQLTFNVTVGVVDNTLPVIQNCPINISVGTDQQSCSAIVNYALPTYSDNCGIATIQQISGLPSGAAFPKGNTTNTFRVTDGSGNFATCSFVVAVTDNIPPTALCKNVSVALNAALTGSITLADINNGSYDNCGPVVVSISSGKTQFDCNDVGQSFPVTILVRDQQGLTSSCTAQVTVTDPNSYCNQPPVAVCKALTLSAGANCNATALAADFNNGSTDPNGDAITFTVSPAAPYAIGTTSVTLTVTDSKGASSSCVTTVTVVDDTKPTITAPANIAVSNNAGVCNAVVTLGTPTTGDNCGVGGTTNDAPSVFPVGVTTVTWTVTDIHNNTNTATQTVTVTDTEKPVITTNGNKEVNNDAGKCGATVVASATAVDNCGVGAVSGVRNDGAALTDMYPVGVTTITWNVTDIHGNAAASVAQTVTVKDNEAPKANCKPKTVTLAGSSASIVASDVDANSSDNCGIRSISVFPSSFNCSNIGANEVTLTVTDIHGNVSTCKTTVTVVGEIPTCSIASIPTSNIYTGGVSTNLYLGYGAQSTTLQVTPAANGAPYTYSWISGPVNLLSSATSDAPVFTPTVAGTYNFTVETTNKYGCKTTCSITICVTDIRVPGTDGKKVYVCHVPPGNAGNPNTLSISVNAVSSHLGNHSGDRLGTCGQIPCTLAKANNSITQSTQASKEVVEGSSEEELSVVVSPNPTANFFTLKLQSRYSTPVSLKVMDATGRVVDAKSNIPANSTFQIGQNYTSGTFYAEMIQGTNRKVVQLIKVRR